MSYHVYEIVKGRFEFDHIRTNETICSSDICKWYFGSDRANENIIESGGCHLTMDGIYHDIYDTVQTSYNRGAGILAGDIVFLQCAQYSEDGDFEQAHIIREYAQPVIM